jgi:hypothetical protein
MALTARNPSDDANSGLTKGGIKLSTFYMLPILTDAAPFRKRFPPPTARIPRKGSGKRPAAIGRAGRGSNRPPPKNAAKPPWPCPAKSTSKNRPKRRKTGRWPSCGVMDEMDQGSRMPKSISTIVCRSIPSIPSIVSIPSIQTPPELRALCPVPPPRCRLARWIASTVTSAGVMPLIRIAWPRLRGRQERSFSRASKRRCVTAS